MLHTELIRQGYAWVGVSAQLVGINSLLNGTADVLLGLDNKERYKDLIHPGDSFSYDIFSQIGQAIKNPKGVSPLETCKQNFLSLLVNRNQPLE